MAFANFILVVFLIVSLLILVVLVMLMRQIKKDGRLSQDKMTTLAAILFIPAILIFALVAKSISGWRADIQRDKELAQISQFVEGVYQPLAVSQRSLLSSFSQMQNLLKDSQSMGLEFPNHARLISAVTGQWKEGQTVLYTVYNDTDKEIRRAWISYNTMDQQDVLSKFSKQAVHLKNSILSAEKKYQRHIHGVQNDLIIDLDRARRLLNANRKPPKSKKQKARNLETLEKIKPFNDRTTVRLVNFLGSIDRRLKEELESLQHIVYLSGQQAEVIRSHLLKNPDLEQPLNVIIHNWKSLEEEGQQHLNQILYAIESEYVALKLGLSSDSPAIKAMHKSLLKNIPFLTGKALKQRKIIDQSYNIKRNQ